MGTVEKNLVLFDLDEIVYQFSGEARIEVRYANIRQGDHLLISGPSGCGKSTVLGLLSLALKPTYGKKFLFQQKNMFGLWGHHERDELARLRANYFGFVSQTAALIPFLTVRENIELPQHMVGKKNMDWFDRLVQHLEIDRLLSRKPYEISIGQRQRVAVARALVNRPRVILADEPTASVHPSLADEILTLLMDTVTATGATLIMTSHDTDRVLQHGLREIRCHVDSEKQQTWLKIDA